MKFKNHTPFPALLFQNHDQKNQAFHVLVLRTTYRLEPMATPSEDSRPGGFTHQPVLADEQTPLVFKDEFWGEINQSSLQYESDLAPFKPRCDILVLAHAYSPDGEARRSFETSVKVSQPNRPRPLPEPPQPLNPTMPISAQQEREFKAQCAWAAANPLKGKVLLHKVLRVTGPRFFRKRSPPFRLMAGFLRLVSFGVLKLRTWRLTRPQPFTHLPLRYEHAYGGQCRIADDDEALRRLPKAYRLTPEQRAQHPDAKLAPDKAPAAHIHCPSNPIGCGFAEAWFLKATKASQIPAPRIEDPATPISALHFWRHTQAKKTAIPPALHPQGFGAIGKTWQPRLRLAGTYDDTWLQKRHPALPEDFDFAYWNAAPASMQIPLAQGDEILEFTNCVPHTAPGARRDAQSQTHTSFALPGHRIWAMVRYESGVVLPAELPIDTMVVRWPEPNPPAPDALPEETVRTLEASITLTYRLTVPADEPIRLIEALFTFKEAAI